MKFVWGYIPLILAKYRSMVSRGRIETIVKVTPEWMLVGPVVILANLTHQDPGIIQPNRSRGTPAGCVAGNRVGYLSPRCLETYTTPLLMDLELYPQTDWGGNLKVAPPHLQD